MKIPHPKTLAYICLIFTFLSCSSNDSEQLVENIDDSVSIQNIPSTSFELEILDLINLYRTSSNLESLAKLNIIKKPALDHTNYMIRNNQMSHDNFNTRATFLIENSNAISVAENVAYGYTNAEDLVQAWINSNGHKENIVGDYTHFDIIARQCDDGKWYFTNIFIKK